MYANASPKAASAPRDRENCNGKSPISIRSCNDDSISSSSHVALARAYKDPPIDPNKPPASPAWSAYLRLPISSSGVSYCKKWRFLFSEAFFSFSRARIKPRRVQYGNRQEYERKTPNRMLGNLIIYLDVGILSNAPSQEGSNKPCFYLRTLL